MTIKAVQVSHCMQGLYHGGLEHINTMARLGKLQPYQAQLVIGSAGWDCGQLLEEVQAGCWFVVAASDHILKSCIFGKVSSNNCAVAQLLSHMM